MPRLFPIFSQSDYLIQVVDTNAHSKWQTVQIQISWLLKKPTDLDQFANAGYIRAQQDKNSSRDYTDVQADYDLTITTLWANLADDKFVSIFFIFPRK